MPGFGCFGGVAVVVGLLSKDKEKEWVCWGAKPPPPTMQHQVCNPKPFLLIKLVLFLGFGPLKLPEKAPTRYITKKDGCLHT